MSGNVIELHPDAPQKFEVVDTSLWHTAERTAILGYKLGGLFLKHATGRDLPFLYNPDRAPGPARHVELEPDMSLAIKTEQGSSHFVDIYGKEHLGKEGSLPPLVMIMPLSLPHNEGFQAPVIDYVQKHAQEQGRPVLVISSEGFGADSMKFSDVKDLDFDKMTDNIHDTLDKLEIQLGITLDRILTTGCSRGGTLSLMMATEEVAIRRQFSGKTNRIIEGVISVAPAGLRPLNTIKKKLKVAKQFVVNEPFHIIRKASNLSQEDMVDYGHTLIDSVPPLRALPAIGMTGLLFLRDTPLENIGQRINPETPVWVVTMQNDGITTPKYWKQEFGHFTQSNVVTLPGHHVSIDSTAKVADLVTNHLDLNAAMHAEKNPA